LSYELGNNIFYDIAALVHDFSLVRKNAKGEIKPISKHATEELFSIAAVRKDRFMSMLRSDKYNPGM
ncbi:MAG: hypothetical protein LBF37_04095, partial [Rickettsiales bacterium]|nr:hypothetical protein [Rickettsiales bacterium]